MGFFKKKKYTEGSAVKYMTRKAAMKKLQLTLKDFRRLCIYKGVYPREPKNRKAAQKGKGGIKILYATKDILFLGADPLWFEMRKIKTQCKKIERAKGMRNFELWGHLQRNRVQLDMDHVVRERYPSFIDALKDLDDCLCLLFLFSHFPRVRGVHPKLPENARRLTMEFLQLVIETRALRKVFVSIKGYYYQAEFRGETITWSIPHHFADQPDKRRDVDMGTMGYFADFYIVLLGFVNFRLYQQHNLYYPPRLSKVRGDASEKELVHRESFYFERIASLNVKLSKTRVIVGEEEEPQLDTFTLSDDPEQLQQIQKEAQKTAKVRKLFEGVKVFLNREVPREPMVICIRACGGEVSWDKTLFVGSTFNEDDETITHQIVDRPSMDKQYISRYYVQPQWIFDSINAAELLPVEHYLMGAVLPPHLSPFSDSKADLLYKPPEELEKLGEEGIKYKVMTGDDEGTDEEDKDEEDEDSDDMAQGEPASEDEEVGDDNAKAENQDNDVPDVEKERLAKKKKMSVKKGSIAKVDALAAEKEKAAENKLMERMVRNKHRFMYNKMIKAKKDKLRKVNTLTRKRQQIDEKAKAEKKAERRERRKAAATLEA